MGLSVRLSPLEERITKIIEPTVTGMGLRLYCVQESGESIQVMVEDPNTDSLSMDACAKLSRAIGAVLDVEDPIDRAYRLEVSSPGIDRLLVRGENYEAHIGLEAKIEMDTPINGQKKFRGRIEKMKENSVVLITEDQGEVTLPLSGVKKAKLVMSDELIKETQKRLKETKAKEEGNDDGTAASC